MKRCIGIKNLQQHLGSYIGLDQYSGMDIFIQVVEAFQDDKRAMLAGRQARGGCHHSLDGALNLLAGAFIGYAEESAGPADPLKGAAKFRK